MRRRAGLVIPVVQHPAGPAVAGLRDVAREDGESHGAG